MSGRPRSADVATMSGGEETMLASIDRHLAATYDPLAVFVTRGEGAWVTDVRGRRHLDMLAGYSAMNFGHCNPTLVEAAREQLSSLTLISRAFQHDRLAEFAGGLATLAGKDMVVPMNTGAEAVETAIKVARKWAYEVKGIPADEAVIITAADCFHGRTTTIVSFSTDADARTGFGPFTPGFREVPFGDADAIAAAITPTTAAVLLEPVQGEAGVQVPPPGYLQRVREICTENDVLLIADEIQSGLGRTGTTFACERDGVVPDLYVLGKALGGGIVPVSAVVGDRDVLGVLKPGQHGSTFGGNPLACAVGSAVVRLLESGELQRHAARLSTVLDERLGGLVGRGVVASRVVGLWAGIDLDPGLGTGRRLCEELAARGVLAKDTHGATIRLSPPLVISEKDLRWGLDQLDAALESLTG